MTFCELHEDSVAWNKYVPQMKKPRPWSKTTLLKTPNQWVAELIFELHFWLQGTMQHILHMQTPSRVHTSVSSVSLTLGALLVSNATGPSVISFFTFFFLACTSELSHLNLLLGWMTIQWLAISRGETGRLFSYMWKFTAEFYLRLWQMLSEAVETVP